MKHTWASSSIQREHDLVSKAPQPFFPLFHGFDQRVTRALEVLHGMFVLGVVAAADMTAGQANP
jgi:hypothetical protein